MTEILLTIGVVLLAFYVGMKFGDWRFRRKMLRDIFDDERETEELEEEQIADREIDLGEPLSSDFDGYDFVEISADTDPKIGGGNN